MFHHVKGLPTGRRLRQPQFADNSRGGILLPPSSEGRVASGEKTHEQTRDEDYGFRAFRDSRLFSSAMGQGLVLLDHATRLQEISISFQRNANELAASTHLGLGE
jgi:hypothetical protein